MVIAYLRERFPLRVYGSLAAAIALAVATRAGGWRAAATDAAFALALLLQFRTWDDLADRQRDARTQPQRLLVRAPDVTLVIAFCGALAVLNLCLAVWRDASGLAVAVLAALNGLFGSWYLSRPDTSRTAVGDHLVLAKYPAILVIVAGARALDAPLHAGVTATALYAAACAYEAWHDPDSGLAHRYGSLKHRLGVR